MLKKIFTYIVILAPLLSIYQTPITTLHLADIALIILVPFLIFDFLKKGKVKNFLIFQFLLISLYMFFQLMILGIFSSPEQFQKILTPTLRILFYYTIISVFFKSYFDTKIGLNFFKKVVLFSSIFLIVQFVLLQFTGIYIPGFLKIPGLTISQGLQIHAQTINALGRVRSVFAEPADFATYCALYLAIDLLAVNKKINSNVLIITLALILSSSSTAILLVAIIYSIYFIINFKNLFLKYSMKFIVLLLVSIIAVFIYTKTDDYQAFVTRTFTDGYATEGRFGNYGLIFNSNRKNMIETIFGEGIVKIDDYIPAFPRIYLYFGCIGILYYFIIMIKNFLKFRGINRISTLLTFILVFPTEFVFGEFILLYAPFIYLDFENK